MASTDAVPQPQKGVPYRAYFDMRDTTNNLITAAWTGKASTVSKDGGAFNTTSATATQITSAGIGHIDLTTDEMDTNSTVLKVVCTNTNSVETIIMLYPAQDKHFRVNVAMVNGSGVTLVEPSGLAADMWDVDISDHDTAGSTGHALVAASGNLFGVNVIEIDGDPVSLTTAADVADAVWDESSSAHRIAGSTGMGLITASGNLINDALIYAVWEEPAGDHISGSTMGDYLGEVYADTSVTLDGIVDTINTNVSTLITGVNVTQINGSSATLIEASGIADAVWQEPVVPHTVAGTMGHALVAASGNLFGVDVLTINGETATQSDANDIADAVWDEVISTHVTTGTAGDALITASGNLIGSGSGGDATEAKQDTIIAELGNGTYGLSAIETYVDCLPATLNDLSTTETAEAVWDAVMSSYDDAGSAGQALVTASGNLINEKLDTVDTNVDLLVVGVNVTEINGAPVNLSTEDDIADAVWTETIADHATPGSAGHALVTASGNLISGDWSTHDAAAVYTAFGDGSNLTDVNIVAGGITTGTFTAGAINAAAIAANAITSSELAQSAADLVWGTASRTLTASTNFNDVSTTEVENAVWNAAKSSHTTPDTFGDYLDDEITSRSSHDAAAVYTAFGTGTNLTNVALASNAVDSDALATSAVNEIVDQVWNEASADHRTAGSTGMALITASGNLIGGASGPDAATIADAVWDELHTDHNDANSYGDIIHDNLNATVSSRSSHSAAAVYTAFGDGSNLTDVNIVAGGITTATFTAGAINAAAIAANAITSSELAQSAADLVWGTAARTLTASTNFNDVSTTEVENAVWNAAKSSHTTPDTFGDYLDDEITSRSSHDAAAVYTAFGTGVNLNAVGIAAGNITAAKFGAGAITSSVIAAGAITTTQFAQSAADRVWDTATRQLTSNANFNDPTAAAIADAVWDESSAAHRDAGSTGMALITASGNLIGAGSILTEAGIADAVWNEDITTHTGGDKAGQALVTASGNLISGDWTTTSLTLNDIADAVWDETHTAHNDVDSYGDIVHDYLNASVSSRSSHSAADVYTAFGTGSNLTAVALATGAVDADALATSAVDEIVDQVWNEVLSGHDTPGSTGHALVTASGNLIGGASGPDAATIATAVWDKDISSYTTDAGDYLKNLFDNQSGWTTAVSVDLNAGAVDATAIANNAIDAATFASDVDIEVRGWLGLSTNDLDTQLGNIQSDTDDLQTQIGTAGDGLTNLNDLSSSDVATAVWDATLSGYVNAGSTGQALVTASGNLISGDWGTATNLQTVDNELGGLIVDIGVNGAGLTSLPLNNLDMGDIRTAIGMSSADLDTQLGNIQSDTDDLQTQIGTAGDGLTNLNDLSTTDVAQAVWNASMATYDSAGSTGQALVTASGNLISGDWSITGESLSASEIRDAVGLATNDLDTQLGNIQSDTDDLQVQIGTDGAGLTDLPLNNLSSTDVENAVWNAAKGDHLVADSFGDYLDDEISSRSSHDAAAVYTEFSTGANLTAVGLSSTALTNIENEILNASLASHDTPGSVGHALVTASGNLISGDWIDSTTLNTRTLATAAYFDPASDGVIVTTNNDKSAYFISGTKTTLDALQDISTAQVNTEVDNALDTALPGSPTANSVNDRLKDIHIKLPSKAYLTGTANVTGDIEMDDATGNYPGTVANVTQVATTENLTNIPVMPTDWITMSGLSTDAVNEIVDQVWDESSAEHRIAGSTGMTLITASGNLIGGSTLTAADVWGATMSNYDTPGTTGHALVVASGNLISGDWSTHSAADIWTAGSRSLSGTINDFDELKTDLESTHGATSWETATGFAVAGEPLTSTEVTQAVWNATMSDYDSAGSTGQALVTASGNLIGAGSTLTANEVAIAVWNKTMSDHATPGSTGHALVTASGNLIGGSIDASDVWGATMSDYDTPGTIGHALVVASGNLIAGTWSTHSTPDLSALATTANVMSASGSIIDSIAGLNDPTAASIADAVWDESIADHDETGKAGHALVTASGNLISGDWIDSAALNARTLATADYFDPAADTVVTVTNVTTTANLTNLPTIPTDWLTADGLATDAVNEIVDQVWNETMDDHDSAGSTGQALVTASGNLNPSAIADAVWDEVLASHVNVGSTGQALVAASGNLYGVNVIAVNGSGVQLVGASGIADAVWDEQLNEHQDAGSAGLALSIVSGDISAVFDISGSGLATTAQLEYWGLVILNSCGGGPVG